jgi:rod shape-determining protein MreC
VNSANTITGGFYANVSNISEYLNLKTENIALAEENSRLKNLLEKNNTPILKIDSIIIDSLKYQQKYTYTNAKVIKNDFTNAFNFITINKGENQGVSQEMAVFNSKGIIGITDNTSKNYARVQSILNKNSKTNARIKNSNQFGSLEWDGKDYNIVQLLDIPRQVIVNVGDTIETDGKSAIFPEGILIGTVLKINKGNTFDNKIDVKLFNDMSNLGYVYVVKSLHKKEIESLENIENE